MSIAENITEWLHTRPDWLQEAVVRLLTREKLSAEDYTQVTELCKTDEGQKVTADRTFTGLDTSRSETDEIELESIGNIEGIENLAPRTPLAFNNTNLSIIYGLNGSGKSGYVRILNNVCGKAHAEELLSNAFSPPVERKQCTITYKVNGESVEKVWNEAGGPIPELSCVDIFDTKGGRLYLSKEKAVSYMPRSVALFDEMDQICQQVKEKLTAEQEALAERLPTLPGEYRETRAASFYLNLKADQTDEEINRSLEWEDSQQSLLDELEKRLKTTDPKKEATELKGRKAQLDSLHYDIVYTLAALDSSGCQKKISLRNCAFDKRKTANEGVAKAIESSSMEGVGENTWRALWEAARKYSIEKAYPEKDFPHSEDDAKCVLCQQPLSDEAKTRFNQFESFVKGELETAAEKAENQFNSIIGAFTDLPDEGAVVTICRAAGLGEEVWKINLMSFWQVIGEKTEEITKDKETPEIEVDGIDQEAFPWIDELVELSKSYQKQIVQLEADAESFDREAANKDLLEYKSAKWVNEQSTSVRAEIERLKKVDEYTKWIRSTDTLAISRKAGEIARLVITDAYIVRFNDELQKLGAGHIKVEMIKTRTTHGRTMHGIRLREAENTRVSPIDILSEGEKRAVELAAFLADVTDQEGKAPFIFDDPISSLDQLYEDKTVDRLIELASERQVIVFTHRLSLAGMLHDMAADSNIICIRSEHWGAGEPGQVPLNTKRPDRDLNRLHDEHLARAERIFNDEGSEAYYPHGKSICSDFRILLERTVELHLLNGVVVRHRRGIQTLNKLNQLPKISVSDCELIDGLMSTYSCYEHSQSSETPVEVRTPEEIRNDITVLRDWYREFGRRPVE